MPAVAWPQVITTVAGTDWFFPTNTLPALNAPLGYPYGAVIDGKGDLYVSDIYNHIVVRIAQDGTLKVVAGNGSFGSVGDGTPAALSGDGGPATSASLIQPEGLALDAAGNLYIADSYRVRKVSPNGIISTVAGVNLS